MQPVCSPVRTTSPPAPTTIGGAVDRGKPCAVLMHSSRLAGNPGPSRAASPNGGLDATREARRTGWAAVVYGAFGLFLTCFVAVLVVRPQGWFWTFFVNWVIDGFEVVVAVMCLVRAVVGGTVRPVALTLGLGLLAWSFGDVVFSVLTLGGGNPPTPSWDDARLPRVLPPHLCRRDPLAAQGSAGGAAGDVARRRRCGPRGRQPDRRLRVRDHRAVDRRFPGRGGDQRGLSGRRSRALGARRGRPDRPSDVAQPPAPRPRSGLRIAGGRRHRVLVPVVGRDAARSGRSWTPPGRSPWCSCPARSGCAPLRRLSRRPRRPSSSSFPPLPQAAGWRCSSRVLSATSARSRPRWPSSRWWP